MSPTTALARASLRYYSRHPWQLALAIVGIALGIAVYTGVSIASTSAQNAFDLSAELVRGGATHRLLPLHEDFSDDVYTEIIARRGYIGAPVVTGSLLRTDTPGSFINLTGIDPLEELSLGDPQRIIVASRSVLTQLMLIPNSAIGSADLRTDSRTNGNFFSVVANGEIVELELIAQLSDASKASASLVTDISTAQEILGKLGRLTRIDLKIDAVAAAEIVNLLPNDVVLVDAAQQDAGFTALSDAFTTNIRALGLLALAIGMFLVYSTVNFAVAQRTSDLSMFRTLGFRLIEISRMLFAEVVILGLLGSLLGVGIGNALANTLTNMALMSVGDYAFRATVQSDINLIGLTVWSLAIGIGATIVAAAMPLWRLLKNMPASNLNRAAAESNSRHRSRTAAYIAIVLLLLGFSILWLPTTNLVIAFTGLFFVLAAAASVVPAIMLATNSLLLRYFALDRMPIAALALRNIAGHHSRLAVASSALALAIATVIGIGILIESFRVSLAEWLDTTLTSDIYILNSDDENDNSWIASLESDSRVAAITRTRSIVLPSPVGQIRLRAFSPGMRGWGLDVLDSIDIDIDAALASGNYIAIAEPFAYRYNIQPGDSLDLPTDIGPQAFVIAAVYRDYNAGGADVMLALNAYRDRWNDPGVDGVGVELFNRRDTEVVATELRSATATATRRITTDTNIKNISLGIFDRTFQITEVLRLLAALVAFFGILSALLAIHLARRRELGILRAIGFSRRNILRLLLSESVFIGLLAGLAAVPIGLLLASLLVSVINVRSFGWSLTFIVPWQVLLSGIVSAVVAASLAGVLPGLKSLRAPGIAMLSVLVLITACTQDQTANTELTTPLTGIRFLQSDTNTDNFAKAIEPRTFAFPADHGMHPEFRNEWWYFTGNLQTIQGGAYGFELTFFRLALAANPANSPSDWRTNQVFLAHFAITNVDENEFFAYERLGRNAQGIASADINRLNVHVENWSVIQSDDDELIYLRAESEGVGIELELDPISAVVLQGVNGLDRKGSEPGNASYYYSIPRLAASGRLWTTSSGSEEVSGLAWLDREWGTSALDPGIAGWDWFALQLHDGRDLMFYQLRKTDGYASPYSAGSITDINGDIHHLEVDDVILEPVRFWRSEISGVRYPIQWRLAVPAHDLNLQVIPKIESQEIALSVRYWEGAVTTVDERTGKSVGSGYLELAGY